jgi:hypothetical protein
MTMEAARQGPAVVNPPGFDEQIGDLHQIWHAIGVPKDLKIRLFGPTN